MADTKQEPKPVRLEKKTEVFPYVTGFCSLGGHEGRVHNTGIKTCKGEYEFSFRDGGNVICKCDCHDIMREIRMHAAEAKRRADEAEVERLLAQPRDFDIHEIRGFNTLKEIPTQRSTPGSNSAPVSDEATAPSVPATEPGASALPSIPRPRPALVAPVLLQSGRLARGSLEDQVVGVIKTYFDAGLGAVAGLTPSACGTMINADKPPSSGAIYSVFKRLEKAGRAVLAEKPFRLVEWRG